MALHLQMQYHPIELKGNGCPQTCLVLSNLEGRFSISLSPDQTFKNPVEH